MNGYKILGLMLGFIGTALHAQQIVVCEPEQNLFSLEKIIRNFNEVAYDTKPVFDAMMQFPLWEMVSPEYNRIAAKLHSPECSLFDIYKGWKGLLIARPDELSVDLIKTVIEFKEYLNPEVQKAKSLLDQHFHVRNPQFLRLLRSLLPAGCLTPDAWERLIALAHRHTEAQMDCAASFDLKPWIARILPDLAEAVKKLETLLEDGDTVIGFGNTPQYLLEALKYSKKKIRLIAVALSGHPGYFKAGFSNSLADVLTEQGLQNFKKYLAQLGLTPAGNHKRMYIPDIIGSGGGIAFFIRRLLENYKDMPLPEIKLIAINSMKVGEHYDEATQMYSGYGLKVPCISLGLTVLAQSLDRVSADVRVTPDFQSWCWHDWETDPTQLPVGKFAPEVIKAIKERFVKADV